MSEATPEKEAFQVACRQVGEFLYHFFLLEREIDDGIGKLLGIEAGVLDIVTANMDFARKVNVLRTAQVFKAEMPDKSRKEILEKTFSAILALNDKRKIVAHCPFIPGKQSGVVFRRAVASKDLKVENLEWSDKEFKDCAFTKMPAVPRSRRRASFQGLMPTATPAGGSPPSPIPAAH